MNSPEHFSYMPTLQRADEPLRRFFRYFDWVLFGSVVLLCIIGHVIIYSACVRFGHPGFYLAKQFAAFFGGLLLLFVLATVNYQIFLQHPKFILSVSLSLLVMVLIFGRTLRGAKAWVTFGFVAFQPAELSKLLAILVAGAYCHKHAREMKEFRGIVYPLGVMLLHVGLILMQPDFGSTLVYFPVLLAMLYVSGIPPLFLGAILILGGVSSTLILSHTYLVLTPALLQNHPLLTFFFRGMTLGKEFVMVQLLLIAALFGLAWFLKKWRMRIPAVYYALLYFVLLSASTLSAVFVHVLKDYQRKRLMIFFNPRIDPMGSGYHVIQSMVALGSGKVFGRGIMSSTQGRLGFLPEQHTDFIFSVLGEETGFLVSGFVILLYAVLIWRAFAIASETPDRFGATVAVGIGAMFAFYAILNLAMVMGMAPVTGLPLPFLSYGGSAMFSSMLAVGILLSIQIRRYMN